MELSESSPAFHDFSDGYFQLSFDKVEALLLIRPISLVRPNQAVIEQECHQILSSCEVALWHLFVTRVDDKEGILILLIESECFTGRSPPILLLDMDWEAKVVQNVQGLVTFDILIVHDEQIVIRAEVGDLSRIGNNLPSFLPFLKPSNARLLSQLEIDLIPYTVPLL